MTFASAHHTSADWQALRKGLHRFVQNRIPRHAVEDVVSDILEAIIRNKQTLGAASNPTAWIYAVARSKVVDFYRKQGRERTALQNLQTDPTRDLAQTSPDSAGLHDCLAAFISELTDADQKILREIDLEQKRQTDFAAQHAIALPTVKSRVQRARRRLRDRLIACCPNGSTHKCDHSCPDSGSCDANQSEISERKAWSG
ncbi:sigma-70 family RNA polymerase sigma factor [Thalassospira sp. CH_XMU1448-2]|uniref:sigma-70 family RNA polymerase sigma factor n=1 Tax=Thalassospira sp. CH_XMU1448-2 TaxID=3107773 RepID=UPI00300BB88D